MVMLLSLRARYSNCMESNSFECDSGSCDQEILSTLQNLHTGDCGE
jgi:hypothetical protein